MYEFTMILGEQDVAGNMLPGLPTGDHFQSQSERVWTLLLPLRVCYYRSGFVITAAIKQVTEVVPYEACPIAPLWSTSPAFLLDS